VGSAKTPTAGHRNGPAVVDAVVDVLFVAADVVGSCVVGVVCNVVVFPVVTVGSFWFLAMEFCVQFVVSPKPAKSSSQMIS